MPEQLELFGDSFSSSGENEEMPPEEEVEGRNPEPSSTTRTPSESRSLKRKSDEKQDYVTVKVGYEEDLTIRATKMLADLHLPVPSKKVLVVWNKRMRSAAGRAFYKEFRIELNPRLQVLEEPQRSEEIDRTFLHELAHLVAYARNMRRRIQPHGPEWKQACADLGIAGENRCHDLGFKTRKMAKKFGYRCPACENVILRVHRMKRRVACFDCCREHSNGRFDSRFVLIEQRLT